jgi:nucleoside-diphosphate-sugar epimerase
MSDAPADRATVALTGASGFVGRHILARAAAAGFRLRVLARDPNRLPDLPPGTERVHGGLENPAALADLVRDAVAVIHCAGAVRGVTRTQFDRVNVAGTAAVAEAAAEAGAGRFLQISSLAAREPRLSAYAASKRAGESAARDAAGSAAVTIFRPPAVYGPGDREMLTLFRVMARGYAPVFGDPAARFSLIFVADLADAAVAWLNAASAPAGTFEPDDGHPGGHGWADVCETVASITGRPVRPLRLPPAVLALPAGLNYAAGRMTGFAPMLTPGKLRELRHPDWVCRAGELEALLGWRPAHDLRSGLLATPGWRD